MGHKYNYEALDRSLKELRDKPDKMFGGLTVLLSGDWRQILPVVIGGNHGDIVDACLKSSSLWSNELTHFTFNENIRATVCGGDQQFVKFLNDIGEGKIPTHQNLGPYKIELPEDSKHRRPNKVSFQ